MFNKHYKKEGLFAPLFLLSIVFQINIFATEFILSGSEVINPQAIMKIDEIGSEVKLKTGTSIYIYARQDYGISKSVSLKEKFERIKKIESDLVKRLKGSFVVITLAYEEKHINIKNFL